MATDRPGLLEKIGYGLGETASNLYFQFFNLFLFYYYTDVFGLNPAAIGTMYLVANLWDAVNDPVMGAVADRMGMTPNPKLVRTIQNLFPWRSSPPLHLSSY